MRVLVVFDVRKRKRIPLYLITSCWNFISLNIIDKENTHAHVDKHLLVQSEIIVISAPLF